MAEFIQTGGSSGGSYASNFTGRLTVWENSYDIASNTSNVGYRLELISGSSGRFSDYWLDYSVTIDGIVVASNGLYFSSMSYNIAQTVCEGTITITHNNDGTKTIPCSAVMNFASGTYSPGDFYPSGNLILTTIPRYASLTEHYVVSTGLNSITVKWNADHTIDWVQYSLNGGAWTDTSGTTYTIVGLAPNTQYSIRTKIRRKNGQLWTESGYIYGTTKDIARVSYAIDFNSDANAYMEFTNSSGATVNLYLEVGNNTIRRNGITGSGGYTFRLTEEERTLLYSLCPNSNKLIVRYVVATLVNGVATYWDFVDKTMTVVNSNPVFSNCEYRDNGTVSTQLTGDNQTIINGYNNLQVIISPANRAIAKNGAKMDKYRLVCGNKSVEAPYSETSDVILEIGYVDSMTFMVYAIDSRKNSPNPVTKTFATWKDYFKPKITEGSAVRTEQVNSETRLTFSGKFWNDCFGDVNNPEAVHNKITTCKYEYKKTTDSEYIEGETDLILDISGDVFSASLLIAGDAEMEGFEITNSYNIRVIVSDEIGWTPATYDILLGAGKPGIAFHRNGVSLGRPYDERIGGSCQIDGHRAMCEDVCRAYFNGGGASTFAYNTAWIIQKIQLNQADTIGTLFTWDNTNKRIYVNKTGFIDIELAFDMYLVDYVSNSDYILVVLKNGAEYTSVAYEYFRNEQYYGKLQGSVRGVYAQKGDYFEMGINCGKTGTIRCFEGPNTSMTLTYRRM